MPDFNRVLVTGAAGYLGWHVASVLLERGCTVHGTSRDAAGLPDGVKVHALELSDGGVAGAKLVRSLRPSSVIHLAANSNPDACAQDPEAARRVNTEATGALATAAAAIGAGFVFSSSDLVFDGSAGPYGEDALPSPLGTYARTKADAERAVLEADPRFLVVRVALLYGHAGGRKGSFTDVMILRLLAGEHLTLFGDQFRSPIEVRDAAELIVDLLERHASGVVHVAGPQRVSRLEHGRALARALNVDPALCRESSFLDQADLALRPADASLKIDRLLSLVDRSPLGVAEGWRQSLERR